MTKKTTQTVRRSAYLSVIATMAMGLGACAAPTDAPETENAERPASASPAASAEPGEGSSADQAGGEATPSAEIARLNLAEGHSVAFVAVDEGVLVVESLHPSMTSALSALDLNAERATAHDVYRALSRPGDETPAAIAHLETKIVAPVQGWGLAKTDFGAMATRAGGDDACDNTSFTSGTYGGILPTNNTWLDRHPNTPYDEFLYSYQSGILHNVYSTRYSYTLNRSGVVQFRGKGCIEVKEGAGQPIHSYYDQGKHQWFERKPQMSLLYRRSGTTNYSSALTVNVSVGQTRSIEWAFFGDQNKKYDWQFRVIRAQPQDFIDYMRSYL